MPLRPSTHDDGVAEVFREIINPPTLHQSILPAAIIRASDEDFEVEEIPAYPPDGSGEHLFLWIQKRGLAAAELVSRISRTLTISAGDIGVAGQKDRHAVTRQFVSVPRKAESRLAGLADAGIQVLTVAGHRHKLRTGHLQGNLFRLTVRLPPPADNWTDDAVVAVSERLKMLEEQGFPSYFGPQRFGHEGSTLQDGVALLQGRLSRKRWPFRQQRLMTRLVLSAVQSAVFNLVVADRVRDQIVLQPLPGDVVIRKNGSRPYLLPADDAATSGSAQTAGGESSGGECVERRIPAGPMFGPEMLRAGADIDARENRALQKLGLNGSEFTRFQKLCSGTRRAMLEFPSAVSAQRTAKQQLQLNFTLRSGTYATVLLREMFANVIDAAAMGQNRECDQEADEEFTEGPE